MKTTTPVRDSTTVYDDDFTPLIVSVPTDAHNCLMEASAALRFRKVPTLFFPTHNCYLSRLIFAGNAGNILGFPCLSLRRMPFKKLSGNPAQNRCNPEGCEKEK